MIHNQPNSDRAHPSPYLYGRYTACGRNDTDRDASAPTARRNFHLNTRGAHAYSWPCAKNDSVLVVP